MLDGSVLWAIDGVAVLLPAAWVARRANLLSPTVSGVIDGTLGLALGGKTAARPSKLTGVSASGIAIGMRKLLQGQDELVEALAAAVVTNMETPRSGPLVSALVTGAGLSGKSTAAWALAGGLYRGDDQVFGIDCGELGAAGVVGKIQGRLAEQLRKDGEVVVLVHHIDLVADDTACMRAITELAIEGKVGGKRLAKRAAVVLTADIGFQVPKKLRDVDVQVEMRPLSAAALDKVVRAYVAEWVADEFTVGDKPTLTLGVMDDGVAGQVASVWASGRAAVHGWLEENVRPVAQAAKSNGERSVSLFWTDDEVSATQTRAGGVVDLDDDEQV